MKSLLIARVKFEPESSSSHESSSSQVEKSFIFTSFDCDSCFHDDVAVVNSKIIKQSGLRSRSIDRSITSVIPAMIRSLLFKDMPSHSNCRFS